MLRLQFEQREGSFEDVGVEFDLVDGGDDLIRDRKDGRELEGGREEKREGRLV